MALKYGWAIPPEHGFGFMGWEWGPGGFIQLKESEILIPIGRWLGEFLPINAQAPVVCVVSKEMGGPDCLMVITAGGLF